MRSTSVSAPEGRSRGQFEVAGAGVLHKAMTVVDAVAVAGGSVRISDLVDVTGLPLGTLHRLLSALVSERLLRQDPATKTYRIGSRIPELASNAREHLDVARLAEPSVERLGALTGESVAVTLVEGDQLVYRAKRDGGGALRISVRIGERMPLHATASGKAVLAFMDPDQLRLAQRRRDFVRFTPRTAAGIPELDPELTEVRQRGVAFEDEEHYPGVRALAAPLIDRRGYAIGSLEIMGPAINLTEAKMDSWRAELVETARSLSILLGGDPPNLNPVSPDPGAVPAELRVRLRVPAFLGSSPLWDCRTARLYWIDVLAPTVNRFDPETGGNEVFMMDDLVGGMGLSDDPGSVILAMRTRICRFDLVSRTLTPLAEAAADHHEHRFNKGGCDAAGRFWTSSMHMGGLPGAGCLFRLDPDGTFQTMDSGLTLPNALGWSPDDRSLYLVDSAARTIFAYEFDLASGQVGARRPLVRIAPELGRPAGLAVDAEGFLWCTHSDGWRITRYAPDGEVASFVSLPVPSANGCAFGDPDLRTLYITTARDRMSPRRIVNAPLAGSVFSHRVVVAGQGVSRFGAAGRH